MSQGVRLRPWWRPPLIALLWALGASGLGLAFNAIRPQGLPLVAPFSYDHDCEEKLVLTSPRVAASVARRFAKKLQGKVLFIDARPAELFAEKHHRGARSIPYSFIAPFSPRDAAPLARYEHIFVYCDSPGDRLALLQAELMRKAGLEQVRTIIGGLAALDKGATGGGQ